MQACDMLMAEIEAHHRAKKVERQVFIVKWRDNRAPKMSGGFVENKTSAIGIGELVAMSAAVFGQDKGRICSGGVGGEM